MFRAVTGLSFLKRHPQSSFRLTSKEIEVPTTNVKDLKGSNEDMKELVVKDKYVVVHWNGLRFPGLVLSVAEEEATVECMAPTKKFWKWPQEKDTLFYKWCDILKVIQPPKLVKRGLFKTVATAAASRVQLGVGRYLATFAEVLMVLEYGELVCPLASVSNLGKGMVTNITNEFDLDIRFEWMSRPGSTQQNVNSTHPSTHRQATDRFRSSPCSVCRWKVTSDKGCILCAILQLRSTVVHYPNDYDFFPWNVSWSSIEIFLLKLFKNYKDKFGKEAVFVEQLDSLYLPVRVSALNSNCPVDCILLPSRREYKTGFVRDTRVHSLVSRGNYVNNIEGLGLSTTRKYLPT
ncbi:hypothetical protein J6590_014363 [Homalodisca vitripennis]|nr:hypothetical protein J6590_014363 [Homalodisca vitripennis]